MTTPETIATERSKQAAGKNAIRPFRVSFPQSELDDLRRRFADIDPRSLQQHGDYMVELAKQFGNAAENDPRPGNVVYFDLFGQVLVHYGQAAATLLLVLEGHLQGDLRRRRATV